MKNDIQELYDSIQIKKAMQDLHITKVSDLEELNYLTFANRCPKNYNVLAIADELNALGYLYPPENEISVNDISMSKRLQNVLIRNNILYLSQLSLHTIFFQNNILCMDDFKHKTAHDLYAICQRDYALTMKTYYTLKKNGVLFEEWENKYLFEVLPKKKSSLIWQKYEIPTVSQFSDYSKVQLKEMTSLSPKLLDAIGHC